jgi:hypothetical protein
MCHQCTSPIRPSGDDDWIAPVDVDERVEENDDEGGADGGDLEEGRRPRMAANPRAPTRAEVDEHMATHLPYRAWCPHCVVSGGRDKQHFQKEEEEVAARGPMVAADYGFLSDNAESREESERKGLTPILIMRDRGSGGTLSMAVPSKGEEPSWVPQRCARWIDSLGHQRMILWETRSPTAWRSRRSER